MRTRHQANDRLGRVERAQVDASVPVSDGDFGGVVAQLKPGDRIQFAPISLDDAQRLYLEREQELAQFKIGLEFRFSRGDAT